MEKRQYLISYLWIMSLLILPLSSLPNRMLLGLLLLWFLIRKGYRSPGVGQLKLFAGMALVLVALSGIANKILAKELLLALSIPAQALFLITVRPGSAGFRKGFHAAVVTILLLLLADIARDIFTTGFDEYFSREQWWNLWHYESFTAPLSLHPTYLSLFLLTGLVMLLFGSAGPGLKKEMPASGPALFGAYLLGLWLSASKVALVALLMILFLFLIYQLTRSSGRRSLAFAALIVIALLATWASPPIRHRLTHELRTALQPLPTDTPSRFSERRALWKSSLTEMDRHPLIGTSFRGISSRQAIYPRAKFFYTPLEKPMNAHNNFIETGLRYGLVFGILLLISTIFGLYRATRKRSFEVLGLLLVFLIVSMTESFLFREQGLSLTALLLLYFYLTENEGNL